MDGEHQITTKRRQTTEENQKYILLVIKKLGDIDRTAQLDLSQSRLLMRNFSFNARST